jgi:hypothetical protein
LRDESRDFELIADLFRQIAARKVSGCPRLENSQRRSRSDRLRCKLSLAPREPERSDGTRLVVESGLTSHEPVASAKSRRK